MLNALGISSPSLHVDCPLQVLTKGGSRLLVGLKSNDLLGSIKPDFEELARLTSHVGAEGYFVFALVENDGVVGTESRMFVPALGIREDAVSGNAHGMLGVYLVNHGLMTPKDGRVVFQGRQGMWMRRPGMVEVAIESSGKVAQSVRIVGDAVIVYEADIQAVDGAPACGGGRGCWSTGPGCWPRLRRGAEISYLSDSFVSRRAAAPTAAPEPARRQIPGKP